MRGRSVLVTSTAVLVSDVSCKHTHFSLIYSFVQLSFVYIGPNSTTSACCDVLLLDEFEFKFDLFYVSFSASSELYVSSLL
jgi:hypothetical protein